MAAMLTRLDIPFYLQRTFVVWWKVCTAPFGREIRFFTSIPEFARAARVCERTARYHVRKFERLELIEIAKNSEGKLLKQNTERRRPVTYRLRTEVLVRNRWDKCTHCGHAHESGVECGCDMGERNGRFFAKDGRVVTKTVRRTCRCKPLHPAIMPTPIRPPRGNQTSHRPSPDRSSPERPSPTPAQEPSKALEAPAPVPAAKGPPVSARESERPPRRLTSREGAKLVAKVAELMRGFTGFGSIQLQPGGRFGSQVYREPMSQEKALIAASMTLGIPHESAIAHLKLCCWNPEKELLAPAEQAVVAEELGKSRKGP